MKIKFTHHFTALLAVLLLAACGSMKTLDRSIAPTPAAAPVLAVGNYGTAELENGLKILVVENHKIPRVRYQLFVDKGPVLEGEKAGYVSLAGDLLSAGTTSMSKAEIDERIDFMGASLNTSSRGGSAACLTKHRDELLSIFSDVILNPSFPEGEMEKIKKQLISSIANSKTDVNSISSNLTSALSYGKAHPYGEVETQSTIDGITRTDLVAFYSTYFKPNISYLVVVGDVTLEQAKADAEKYFGSWKRAFVEKGDFTKPAAPASNRVAFVPLDGAVQSAIDITYPVDFRLSSSDYLPAVVMNNILGGGVFSGRLLQNLREDKAFTYAAWSSLTASQVVGSFSATASVRSEVTDSALTEFSYELNRIASELVADSTLEFVKNGMVGRFALSLESPETVASFALNIERFHLPSDYYDTYLSRLQQVTAEQVLAAAKKYIKPTNLWITVVGNEEIMQTLAPFAASGVVEKYDIYGEPFKEIEEAPSELTAQDVIAKYYEALGGLEALKKIISLKQKGSFNASGMELDMTLITKDNNKLSMEMSMGGQVVIGQKFDGTKGYRSQMGNDIPMTAEEIASSKQQADLLYESRYEEVGSTATLTGLDNSGGESMYVIEIVDAAGQKSKDFYSVESGLKMMSSSTVDSPMGPMTQVSEIKEYKEFGGMLFPVNTVEQIGPQVFEVKIKSVEINPTVSSSTFK